MKIFIGADHRGFIMKKKLLAWLEKQGHEVVDCGNKEFDPTDDFPDFAFAVAKKVTATRGSRGIVLCGSGVGVNIAANKVAGVRASTAINSDEVRLGRQHDDMNVLAISADFTSQPGVKRMVEVFLETEFLAESRFLRRLKKIKEYEDNKE